MPKVAQARTWGYYVISSALLALKYAPVGAARRRPVRSPACVCVCVCASCVCVWRRTMVMGCQESCLLLAQSAALTCTVRRLVKHAFAKTPASFHEYVQRNDRRLLRASSCVGCLL